MTNYLILSSTQQKEKRATQKMKPSVCWSSITISFVVFGGHNFIQKLIKDKRITEAKEFNLPFRYIDDVPSTNENVDIKYRAHGASVDKTRNLSNYIPLIHPQRH